MLLAFLSNGTKVYINQDERTFFHGQERGMWFPATTTETNVEDRIKLKINSKHVVAIRERKE